MFRLHEIERTKKIQTIKIRKGIEIIREANYDCVYCSQTAKRSKNYIIDDHGSKKTYCKDCIKMLYGVDLNDK